MKSSDNNISMFRLYLVKIPVVSKQFLTNYLHLLPLDVAYSVRCCVIKYWASMHKQWSINKDFSMADADADAETIYNDIVLFFSVCVR